jgi:hypothetical protein
MTICIAAICDKGHGIVLASDRELGINFTSAEFPDGKFIPLFQKNSLQWAAGIAGAVSNAIEVIAAVRRRESSLETKDSFAIKGVVEEGYREARLHVAEGKYLASRGLTLKEFRAAGVKELPATTYANIDAQIAYFDFEADLIIAGFGDEMGPTILTVTNPGICTDHTKLGFWCVGSGSPAAQMSLFARSYSWLATPEAAAYSLLEAKINAEHAVGVGTTTDIHLIRKGASQTVQIQPSTMKVMRDMYEELKPKPFGETHQTKLMNANEFKIFRGIQQ